jgi:hypothetical protein
MIWKKIYLLLLLVSTLAVGACDDDDDRKTVAPGSTIVRLTATLDGAQQVPAVQTTASGEFRGTYNKETRELVYKIDYRGMTPNAGHLHYGMPGTTGSVAVTFPQYATSPIEDRIILPPGDGQKLISGEMYVNLHSATHRAGELRGNIKIVP